MLRSFHYIDEKGKDQGINGECTGHCCTDGTVRNRASEIATLLGDLEKIRQERRKAKANKAKYGGVGSDGGMSFTQPGGGRFGGFGSESVNSGGGGGGSGSASYRGGGGYDSGGDGELSFIEQGGSDTQIIDEEPHLKPQPSLTSTKEQMISQILVGPGLLLVNVQLDLSRLQRVPLEHLRLWRSQRRLICSTLEMMSLRLLQL